MSGSRGEATGLRERKKRRTRLAIQEHALRLFAEQGYDATTVEQIAAAAEVSPSTFFRYYPTKEDVVLYDEYDPIFYQKVLDRPVDEPPIVALHAAMRELMPELEAHDRETTMARLRLTLQIPALRARIIQNTTDSITMVATALARRAGRTAPSYEDEAATGAYLGMAVAAMVRWIDQGDDPVELLERGYAALRAGFLQ